MKKVAICLSLLFPSVGFACPSIEGTWVSSLEKFESFNQQWANVEDKPWSFMIQTQGREIISYRDNAEMVIDSPETELEVGDKTITRPSSLERVPFSLLGCTENSVALQYERYGKKEISQLHFENDDLYWVYMGAAGADGNSHIREYYSRQK